MKDSSKSALGGIIAALSVSIMLLTYISPSLFVYSAPAVAGVFLVVIVGGMGYKWAFGTYAAVSILSMFLIADKEAAVFYVLLFGYYPILRTYFAEKIKNKVLLWIAKIFIFNIALALALLISNFVFGIDYSEFTEQGKWMVVLFLLLMNLLLIIYDLLVYRLLLLYTKKIHKRIRKLFK